MTSSRYASARRVARAFGILAILLGGAVTFSSIAALFMQEVPLSGALLIAIFGAMITLGAWLLQVVFVAILDIADTAHAVNCRLEGGDDPDFLTSSRKPGKSGLAANSPGGPSRRG